MDIREKLVELLHKGERCPGVIDNCFDCQYHSINEPCDAFGATVDMLLANGVIVFPVQVGDTVYGRFSHRGESIHECRVIRVKVCQNKNKTIDFLLDVEFDIIDPYYCDGRLMTCCNQVVFGSDLGDWDRVYRTREEAEAAPTKGE